MSTETTRDFQRKEPAGSSVFKVAAVGSAIGAVLGGLAAVAGVGWSNGALLLVAGPMFAGTGAVVGGFIGAMVTLGVERETTRCYDRALRRGDILVAVECDPRPGQEARPAEAERVLARAGAEPIALAEG